MMLMRRNASKRTRVLIIGLMLITPNLDFGMWIWILWIGYGYYVNDEEEGAMEDEGVDNRFDAYHP